MKLFVCWGTFSTAPRPGGHPCGNAYNTLRDAGYEPELVHCYGSALLPDAVNLTAGRQEVKRLTGKTMVPVLVTDDDRVVSGSHEIMAWTYRNTPGSPRA